MCPNLICHNVFIVSSSTWELEATAATDPVSKLPYRKYKSSVSVVVRVFITHKEPLKTLI